MKLCEYNIGKYLTNDYKYYEHVFCFILFRDERKMFLYIFTIFVQ